VRVDLRPADVESHAGFQVALTPRGAALTRPSGQRHDGARDVGVAPEARLLHAQLRADAALRVEGRRREAPPRTPVPRVPGGEKSVEQTHVRVEAEAVLGLDRLVYAG